MIASNLIAALTERRETLAVAESLTGGLVAASLTDVPGSSRVFLGGLVTYATESKVALLGIDSGLIDRHGVCSQEVAEAMALAVRERFASTWGVATTGVAGPGPHQGIGAGEVWIAISGPQSGSEHLSLGDLGRSQVRGGAVTGALALLSRILRSG
jgi:nicotinamide-nucleotide amidase